MMERLGGGRSSSICLAVWTQYRHVTAGYPGMRHTYFDSAVHGQNTPTTLNNYNTVKRRELHLDKIAVV